MLKKYVLKNVHAQEIGKNYPLCGGEYERYKAMI